METSILNLRRIRSLPGVKRGTVGTPGVWARCTRRSMVIERRQSKCSGGRCEALAAVIGVTGAVVVAGLVSVECEGVVDQRILTLVPVVRA